MTERDHVVAVLRARGEHDKAVQVTCALPTYIDLTEDAAHLASFGVRPEDLARAGAAGP